MSVIHKYNYFCLVWKTSKIILWKNIHPPQKVEFEKTIAWIKKPSRHPSLIVKISKQSSCNCIFHQYIIRLVIYRPLSTSHKKWQFELLVPFQNQFRRNRIFFFFFLSSHPEFMIIIIYFFLLLLQGGRRRTELTVHRGATQKIGFRLQGMWVCAKWKKSI